MSGTLPTDLSGSRGSHPSGPRTSIASGGQSKAQSSIFHKENSGAYTSITRAQQAKLGAQGMGPTTSINRLNQQSNTTTSINRKNSAETSTSVYGRSRGIEDHEADDKRFDYARRRIFSRKRKEQKAQIRAIESRMKGSGGKARSYMKKLVKGYSWKKPLGEGYEKKEVKEMKTKIDNAAKARNFGKSDVETMKKLVDKLE